MKDMVLQETKIRCPFCLERQTILVEPDGGESQNLIVDCQVCCHPIDIQLLWNDEKQKFKAIAEKGSGF